MAVEWIVWIDVERYDEKARGSRVSEDIDVGLGRAATFNHQDKAARFATRLQAKADELREETSSDTTPTTAGS